MPQISNLSQSTPFCFFPSVTFWVTKRIYSSWKIQFWSRIDNSNEYTMAHMVTYREMDPDKNVIESNTLKIMVPKKGGPFRDLSNLNIIIIF